MKRSIRISTLTLATLAALGAAPAWAEEAEVVAEIKGLESTGGFVGCLLFTSADGFPKEPTKAAQRMRIKANEPKITCRFVAPPGRYAISVLHDEDGDGEMDTNFLGIPSEAYGASNNVLPSMSAPEFGASSFSLTDGEKKTLQIQLKN
jgi:uncharacterized protein (DUF2141 family)